MAVTFGNVDTAANGVLIADVHTCRVTEPNVLNSLNVMCVTCVSQLLQHEKMYTFLCVFQPRTPLQMKVPVLL